MFTFVPYFQSLRNMKREMLLFCCVLSMQIATAQRSSGFILPERLFREGQAMFIDRNYAGCIDKIAQYKPQSHDPDLIQESDFLLAACAFHQGKSDAGMVLHEFLDAYPQTGHRNEICFMLGSTAFRDHDYTIANYWFDQCDPDLLPEAEQDAARYSLAYISYREGDYELALNRFLPLKNHPVFQPDVLYYITQIYFVQKKYPQVIQDGQTLLHNYPGNAHNSEIERLIGISYYQAGDYSKTVRYLKPPLNSDTDYYMLGVSYYNLNNPAQAIIYLNKSNPVNDLLGQSAYLYLGQSYLQTNDKTNALRAFESASRLNFDASAQEAALYNYAMLLHQNSVSGFGEAVTVLENFIRTYPRSVYTARVNDALVDVYLTSKNYNTALSFIAKIQNPGRKIIEAKQKIYYYLGTIDFTNGQYDRAIESFTNSFNTGDYAINEKQQSLYWRGESYYRKAGYANAAKDYQAFLNTGNKTGDLAALAGYNLGYCSFMQADYAKAKTYFQTFINQGKNDKNRLADAWSRLGDCYFQNRQFTEAENAYNQSITILPAAGDYALFQKGYVMGLQKDYQGKISQMDRLIKDFPASLYVPDALYEKGRAYVLLNNPARAIETYQQLMTGYPNSNWARSAGLQTGLLYYNTNQLPKAASAYKEVISKYPGSNEAKEALQDLKSVYFDLNDITGYTGYVRSLGDKGLEAESIQYSEEAIGKQAELQFKRKDYAAAFKSYEQLQNIAVNKTNRTIAFLGMIRSASELNNYQAIIQAATGLLEDKNGSPEIVNEAKYYRAKAYLNSGEKKQAEKDLEDLAQDTRTAQGAEARYLLAQYYFDAGNAMEAKIVIQDFIQQGTPHAYWLAKSFILLSDIYAADNDKLQARQYLESLQTNYKNTTDDIHRIIKERLNKLK
jgi:tetratricopeptide (TPR) repeat protein